MRSLRLIALLAIPAQFAFAQTAPAGRGSTLTLDEAIAVAQRNNPTFQQVENNLRTANAQLRQTYGQLLPHASATLQTGYQQGGTQIVSGVQLAGSSDSYQSYYSIGLGYTLSPSMAYLPKAARATRNADEATIASQAEVLRSTVTTAYIQVLEDESLAAEQDTLVQSAAGSLDLVNAKAAVGAATIVDVRTAEVALGQAKVAALQSHNNAQVDKLRLFQDMGIPANMDARLTTEFSVSKPAFSLDSLIRLARRVNPDLAAKKSVEVASDLQVKVAKSQYLPTLSLSTGYGAQAFGYTSSDILASQAQASVANSLHNCMSTDSLRVGAGLAALPCGTGTLTSGQLDAIRASNRPFNFQKTPYGLSAALSLPIFNGYTREANIEQQRVVRDNALSDLRARDLQISTDVAQAYYTLITDASTVDLQTQIAAKSSEELAAAQERYKVGAASFLDVTIARGDYQKAQIDRVNSVYEYHKAFAALENAVGRPLR